MAPQRRLVTAAICIQDDTERREAEAFVDALDSPIRLLQLRHGPLNQLDPPDRAFLIRLLVDVQHLFIRALIASAGAGLDGEGAEEKLLEGDI